MFPAAEVWSLGDAGLGGAACATGKSSTSGVSWSVVGSSGLCPPCSAGSSGCSVCGTEERG